MKGRASNEGVGPGYLRRSLVIMGKVIEWRVQVTEGRAKLKRGKPQFVHKLRKTREKWLTEGKGWIKIWEDQVTEGSGKD